MRAGDLRQQPPEIGLAELDLDMLGAERWRDRARRRALVGDARAREADGEGLHRPLVEPRHHRQHGRGIDAAGQEHAVGHVGALMQQDAVGEARGRAPRAPAPSSRGGDAAAVERLDAAALDDAALGDHHRLARQHALDAGEDRLAAGGELKLQQLVARLAAPARPATSAAGDQRLRLRGEGEALRRLDVIERLDAERIARQHEPPRRRIVQRDRIHAAQLARRSRARGGDRDGAAARNRTRRERPCRRARRAARCSCRSRHWR